jgi:hypothetical protein
MALPQQITQNPSNEVFDFLLSKPSPEAVIALRPSQEAQSRVRYLLDGNRNDSLTDSEKAELDMYLQLEHFVRQLKIRAQEKLAE